MKTKYELIVTGECKQNLKLCKKRGLPWTNCSMVKRLMLNIVLISFKAIVKVNGSVTSNLTGCSSGNNMTRNSY